MEHAHKAHLHEFTAITFLCPFLCLLIIAMHLNASAEEPPTIVITCLGDSVTHSYPYGEGDPQEDPSKTYAGQLASKLEDDYPSILFEVHNHGINGETANGLRDKLDPQHANFAHLLDDNPEFVLLMIGGNDIAGADPGNIGQIIDQTVIEVGECITHIKGHTNPGGDHPTLIFSTFIPNRLEEEPFWGSWGTMGISMYNNDLNTAWNGDWQALLEDGDIKIETNWRLWTQTPAGLRENYGLWDRAYPGYMYDAVHPNNPGYAVMAQNWFENLCTFPSLMDSDNDGLFDNIEDSNGNGIWDEGEETNFNSADTDGDGFNDLAEVMCAGIPTALNPNAQPTSIKINFQPFRVATPDGHLLDGGRGFSAGTGYGW